MMICMRQLFRVFKRPNKLCHSVMRKRRTLPRITVTIGASMAGVGGIRGLLSGGTEFLAISGIVVLTLVFIISARPLLSRLHLQEL